MRHASCTIMSMTNTATFQDIDPSDTFDSDRFVFWEVPNTDHTDDVPMADRFPGTTDLHPMDCTCLPCQAQAECDAWEADFLAEQAGERAFAEALERRAENGTWFGRDDEPGWF